ncbi:MAG: TlpA family protein disulfide reductase [Planctomycetota bacterium]|jgi:hypothetical protein
MRSLAAILAIASLALADAADELVELQSEFDGAKLGRVEKYKSFKPRFEKLATQYPGTEEALTAKLWLLQQAWWLYRDRPAMHKEAGIWADQILKEYPKSKRLSDLALYHYVFSAEQKQKYFALLVEKSPHKSVQAAGLFGLARAKKDRALFGRLAKEYADEKYRATTYGAMAKAHLNIHDRSALAVGKPAPEIEGRNHEGKPMKLSEFRGKVVVLDFWGDW